MALRTILTNGDPMLNKICRPVTEFNDHLHMLLDDMADTLLEANGVGLAGPQVGILRQIALVLETNVEDEEDVYIVELINPEIIDQSGEQDGAEGCLSVPGVFGMVKRPEYVKVKAQDRDGNWFEYEGEGLTARAFCHEIDHLSGILFLSKASHILTEEELSNLQQDETDGE